MSDEPKDRIDRRDFVTAAIALGASAALGSHAATAHAQDTKGLREAATLGTEGGTIFTGDVIQEKKVISALDLKDLEPGAKHALYFQGVQMPSGQYWYVSVIVAKGAKPGKRILLVSGVHGDEMSPVHTLQTVMHQLDPAQMSGTVMAVLDVSRPAVEGMARRWPNSGRGIDLIDMNREWPGNENGPGAPSRHAWLLFNKLFRPNADYALDFHTGTTGMELVSFHLARMELPEVRAMAELFPIENIFDNPAYPTLLANAFIDVGIPALTPEIGSARIFDLNMIPWFVEGTMNVLKHHGVIAGPIGRTARDSGVLVAKSEHTVLATHGGFVELLVKLNEKVEAGQKVAVQRDTFGEVVAEYTSGAAGKVLGRRTDATAEPGIPLLFLLRTDSTPEGLVDFSE